MHFVFGAELASHSVVQCRAVCVFPGQDPGTNTREGSVSAQGVSGTELPGATLPRDPILSADEGENPGAGKEEQKMGQLWNLFSP